MRSLDPRRCALALLFLALLPGCTDSLGISGSDCTSQMNRVRRDEGGPPDQRQENDIEGDFSEVWTYWDGSSGRRYSFRWGVSVLSCQMEGPAAVSRVVVPERGSILP
jgi:hypothetical protein